MSYRGMWAVWLWFSLAWGADLEIPPSLKPWTGWALHGVEGVSCPHRFDADQPRLCAWPGPLILHAAEHGGAFRQDWQVHARSFVLLPGSSQQWPQAVTIDGQPAAVVGQENRPGLWLDPGRHRIEGTIPWSTLPATLPIPPQTGRVELTLQGRPEPFPYFESDGRLWLRRQLPASPTEEKIKLRVFRLLEDEVPQLLTTKVVLDVAGPAREFVLPKVGLDGFTEFALTSPLPVRLEPDGQMRLGLSPGRFELEVRARSVERYDKLELDRRSAPWPPQEVWSFAARPELRPVREQGGRRIDPTLAEVPPQWQRYPAYLMAPGETFALEPLQRSLPQDALSLERTMWLDFTSSGMTIQDRLRGTLLSTSRLIAQEVQLGEVRVDGRAAFITVLEDDPRPGVQVQRGRIDVEAIGHYHGTLANLPANGWAHRFQAVEAEINFPPGWQILAVFGADRTSGAWVERWTLLDLFLVLLLTLAIMKMRGWLWGGVALVGLALSWHEPGAPRFLWLNLIAAGALAQWLPSGRIRPWATGYLVLSAAVLIVAALPLFVYELRAALYPQLELPHAPPVPIHPLAEGARALAAPQAKTSEEIQPALPALEEALIQTGPGVPDWRWHRLKLSWLGPVETGQKVQILAVRPVIARFLRVLAVALLASLLWGVLGRPKLRGGSLIGLLILGFLPNCHLWAQGFPDPQLLETLKGRLTEPAKCLPRCAEIGRAQLAADPGTLHLKLEVQAAIATAVPLPQQSSAWTPAMVQVDGKPHDFLLRDSEGKVWLALPAGVHKVELAGPVPERDRIVLHFPLPPRRFDWTAEGWHVFGLDADGLPSGELELVRARSGNALSPMPLPGFVRLERQLSLGLEWYVDYRLERLSAPDEALVLRLPLLPGESLLTQGFATQAGYMEARLAPGQSSLSWRTRLERRPELILTAPPSLSKGQPGWFEVWRLEVSPVWHVKAEGLPPVSPTDPERSVLEWRPWPGERLALKVSRPHGVQGPTLTLDRATLTLRPGKQGQAAELVLDLHSSRGSLHPLALPAGSILERVEIDGQSRSLGLEQGRLNLPVDPGFHQIRIFWHQPEPPGYLLRTPPLDLGMVAANLNLHVEQGTDRWVLAVGGPVLGPAVLFWGVVAVLSVLALALGRIRLTPLSSWQWFWLLIGLSQPPAALGAIVVGWLLLLGVRQRWAGTLKARQYNLIQLVTVAATMLALVALLLAVRQGLLGLPDMQVTGHGSTASRLSWYQDRSGPGLPQAWVVWAPLWTYRLLMLAWALWLAFALIGWLRWLAHIIASQGLWRR